MKHRHVLPGRIRLELFSLKYNKPLEAKLINNLMKLDFIKNVKINITTGSILVKYNSSVSQKIVEEYILNIINNRQNNRQQSALFEVATTLESNAKIDTYISDTDNVKKDKSMIKREAEVIPWHTLSRTKILNILGTDKNIGLINQEANFRLQRLGLNKILIKNKKSWLKIFLQQFDDYLVKILLGAVGISLTLGRVIDAIATLSIIVTNAIIGTVQEVKADSSLDSLTKLAAPTAKVIRENKELEVKSENIVPGDIILVEAGDKVPADCRILETFTLEVDESSLTGESFAVSKTMKKLDYPNAPLGDRSNILYTGTVVTKGRAKAVVISTGMNTEMGQIADSMQNKQKEQTPLQIRLEELGRQVVKACLIISGGIFIVGLLRGMGLINMFMTGITLAVAAIPESLSAFVTIAMALGMQRMLKKNIIVRKMTAVETLGSTTVICTDKTGTLTKNEMTVRSIYTCDGEWTVSGEGFSPYGKIKSVNEDIKHMPINLLKYATLCNNADIIEEKHKNKTKWIPKGDPTEAALLVAAIKGGIIKKQVEEEFPKINELPFESEKRRMSTICQDNDRKVVLTKGATDEILTLCNSYIDKDEIKELTLYERTKILEANDNMTKNAYRVLAVAYRYLDDKEEDFEDSNVNNNLIFVGLIGMVDPPRAEVKEAIKKCNKAGVGVVMITGDHPITAEVLAKELGILNETEEIMIGSKLNMLSDSELDKRISNIKVFARTNPQQKLRIVKSLKRNGNIVAMTGDGVNDAPAIRESDIGLSMGRTGTEVTKEASALILTDDNFATIVAAMEEGRNIYSNIKKSVRYLLATNVSEVIVMFLSVLCGLPLPLIPIQLLWLNLIGDGLPAIALAADPAKKEIMDAKPRPKQESLFANNLGKKIMTRGLLIGLSSLGVYYFGLATGNLILARTLVLCNLIISQIIHVFDCRADNIKNEDLISNKFLLMAVGIATTLLIGGIYYMPLRNILKFSILNLNQWLFIISLNGVIACLDKAICYYYDMKKNNKLVNKFDNMVAVNFI